MPALSAGLPSIISEIRAPSDPLRSKVFAISGVTFWITTPSQPRITLPLFLSWERSSLAMFIGIANPIPWPPDTIAVLSPTTSPFRLNSGPPLFPGLIEASVWIKSSYGPAPITLPFALTMPAVTVVSNPKGLPMATTQSPTSRLSESPNVADGSVCFALILIRAMSVLASRPITVASYSLPSISFTFMLCAFSMTWLLVRMYPSRSIIKPEPKLFCLNSLLGASPKNRSKKSSPKKSLKGADGPENLCCKSGPFTTVVVLMFTTDGLTVFMSPLRLGKPLSKATFFIFVRLASNCRSSVTILPLT
ncbi:MAG: hypothetical protein A4E58_01750 [Syntrophorhabdus sp. PtaB.Bin006]|nr:MAG: hypothetical protein A4E58_01750 [Syntrophorhabdus sp. PtaB.Bin006]